MDRGRTPNGIGHLIILLLLLLLLLRAAEGGTPEGRAVSVTRELDLSLLCRIWLFGRHLVSLAKIAEVWPPFFLATETPDITLEYTSREIWSE